VSSLLVAAASCAVAMLVVGCGHTETHEVMLRSPAPPTRSQAELYLGDRRPARPVYELGLVQSRGFGRDANLEDVTSALAERAARLGCDAVVHVAVDRGYTMAHAVGTCVRYLAPGQTFPEPPRAAPAGPPKP
jgi:hypothetical protein